MENVFLSLLDFVELVVFATITTKNTRFHFLLRLQSDERTALQLSFRLIFAMLAKPLEVTPVTMLLVIVFPMISMMMHFNEVCLLSCPDHA